jgi:hypothetical protein
MYDLPAEFMRQKTTLVGPITLTHVLGIGGGYLLGRLLGGQPPVVLLCSALGLILTAVKAQGLALVWYVPILAGFLYRKLIRGDTVEPEQAPAAQTQAPAAYGVFAEDGTPILVVED